MRNSIDLLQLDVSSTTEHFSASRVSYSTQALPENVLLDTLVRPNSETWDTEERSCVKWIHDPQRAVSHVVIGNAPAAGGQWVDNPVRASWDIETLSYAGMLSLPSYSFAQYYRDKYGESLPAFIRPTRRQVADYLSKYPSKLGISDSLVCGQTLSQVSRTQHGFEIGSHGIRCKNLVLASGIFTKLIPPRPLLQPLQTIPTTRNCSKGLPFLVVGSGFSAADVIVSAPPDRKIIHIFKWAPKSAPSPLRACHQQAYPEYAGVYRNMKAAALAKRSQRPTAVRSNSFGILNRDWLKDYEGLPNTAIVDVKVLGNSAEIILQPDDGPSFSRTIGSFAYVVGRRGSLDYLDANLQNEVSGGPDNSNMLSGQTLRAKALQSTEVAPNVFIIGSLTGDSLVRFAYGGCVFAAGRIMSPPSRGKGSPEYSHDIGREYNGSNVMNGLDGHCGNLDDGQQGKHALERDQINGI